MPFASKGKGTAAVLRLKSSETPDEARTRLETEGWIIPKEGTIYSGSDRTSRYFMMKSDAEKMASFKDMAPVTFSLSSFRPRSPVPLSRGLDRREAEDPMEKENIPSREEEERTSRPFAREHEEEPPKRRIFGFRKEESSPRERVPFKRDRTSPRRGNDRSDDSKRIDDDDD